MVLQEGDRLKANTCTSKDDFVQVNNQSTFVNMSPKQFPPIQVMERPSEGYDPNRISTSVFGRPSTAVDWSVASNESLFSINAGNPNFSMDLGFKTGELRQSDESVKLKQVSPATKGGVDLKKILDMPTIAEPINDFTYAFRNNQVATNIRQSGDPLSAQCLPDQSVLSFPLTGEKKSSCSPCHCHGCCKWLRWPSCNFKCFSCSGNCCKLPSCKCLTCSSCSCKCLTCSKSCCKCPNWLSCKCLTCSSCSCKCPTCPSSCFNCPNCLSCKCLTCSSCSCKCPTCPNCLSCTCQCSSCM